MSEDLNNIKELRDKTGAGFLDCKKALIENNNNIEEAIDSLRRKGLAKATKKLSRDATEGAVGIYSNKNSTIILKINSETDFAAKSDTFLDFMDNLGSFALNTNNLNLNIKEFNNLKLNEKSVSDLVTEMIAKIGENIILNQLEVIEHKDSHLKYYVHNPYRKNIGKIISAVQYSSNTVDEKIESFSKNICMHIAALKPEAIDENGLTKDMIDKEIKIQKDLILSSGKPSNVIDKILEGKMKKFFSEITLMNQNFVIDPDKTVREAMDFYIKEYSFALINFKLISLV
ncbi:MAG: Elongation factor Ts [Alphaproteobacteria bacterium MarineAlpha5_Bin5]|nr:MAG: Elongation factor Ts [Alphaproteobacteria bacterium MarineAlpha5_Bin5]